MPVARVRLRVEPDEPDPPERALQVPLDDGRPCRDLVDLADRLPHPVEMLAEYRLERRFVAALGQILEASREPAHPPDEADDRHRERQDDEDQPADDRAEIGRDERVDIGQGCLRGRVGRV